MKGMKPNIRVRRLVVISLSVALAAAGAFVKIPSPVGTVALDSWPGFACAVILGPEGALAAFGGHLASGLTAGFPLGLFLHSVIAVEMALCALAFRWVWRRFGAAAAVIVATALNGLAAPFALVPWLGKALVIALLLPLTVAAAVNAGVAALVAREFLRGSVRPGRRLEG